MPPHSPTAAAIAAALAKIADGQLPILRGIWDSAVADLSRYGRLTYTSHDELQRCILSQRIHIPTGYVDLATWSPVSMIYNYLLECSDIDQRKALLQRIVDAALPAGTHRPSILTLLEAYQHWAKTAVWESPRMDLNKRMKQFVRQWAWLYCPALPPPALVVVPVPPSAPPAPVPEPVAEPVAEPQEEEHWPIEPMAEPIVAP